ncbi:MAG: right-handed parallel beta-helix repeat-containing protein [Caldilineaceae bacterium]|nr:right-handed parallel beta-helix repeat-containing protein [Caldilineaceae bacterium]
MQARSGSSQPAHWLVAAILLLCALLTPAATFAAPLASPHFRPLTQDDSLPMTVERWVDAAAGSDSGNCTRETPPPEEEDDEEAYIYHSCATIVYALSKSNPGDVIHVAGRFGGLSYAGNLAINKKVTLIGGYISPFGPQISPPRNPALFPTIIQGTVSIQGLALLSAPDTNPMEVRLESVQVTGGGIDIIPGDIDVSTTLESVVVYNSVSANNGGGINISGARNKLTVSKSTIRNNFATNGAGGGIYAAEGSIVELGGGTEIRNNSAQSGAGIAADGALTITTGGGVTITTNIATGNGGGIHASGSVLRIGSGTAIFDNQGSKGAGVYLASGTNTLSGAAIHHNGSTSTTSQGGGIYVSGGTPTLENLEITENSATEGGGLYLAGLTGGKLSGSDILSNTASADGGGFYLINGGSGFAATSLTLQGNNAQNGGGAYIKSSNSSLQSNTFAENSATSGGGLYLDGSNGTQISALQLTGNNAAQGGGLYATHTNATLSSPTIQENSSTGKGAGLYATNSTLTFMGAALFQENQTGAEGGGGYLSASHLSFQSLDMLDNEGTAGGGFYAVEGGRVTATALTSFIGNKATTGAGGALYLKGDGSTTSTLSNLSAQENEAVNGGALYAENVTLTLGTTNVANNKASERGGAAYITSANVTVTGAATLQGNEASLDGGGIYALSTAITFNNGAQFTGNQALGGSGGGLYLATGGTANFGAATFFENRAAAQGGGLFATTANVIVAATTKFESNVAQAGNGGGFYISGSSLALGGVTLKNNSASGSGGGGFFANGTLSVSAGTLLDGNLALTGGGLATLDATNVQVDAAHFTNNSAGSDGGALHLANSPITVQNGAAFSANSATAGRGGAIYVEGGSATLNGINGSNVVTPLTFSKNKAGSGGGALHITTGTLSLLNSTFSENEGGTGFGGGAYLKASSATLSSSSFSKNLANSGAGLYLADTPSATLGSLQLIENSSSGPGGALYLSNSTAALDKLTLRGNQAGGEGGALYALFSRVEIVNTLIVGNRVTALATYGAGLYVGNSELNITHSTIANNTHTQLQGSAHGFFVAPPIAAPGGAPTHSSVTLTNAIVSGHAVGLNLLAGNNATFNAVLWNNAHFNWTGAGNFSVARSRRGDPRFVNATTHDYHLRRDSAAFDQGVNTPLSVDREGVARTQGLAPDLGAYEHRYVAGLYLTSSVSPAFVRSGDTLTIRLRVRNQSASAANGVMLRATLPTQFLSPAISAGGCQGIFCEVNLGTLAAGADLTVEINVTVNGAAPATGLLNLLTNITLAAGNFTTSDTATTTTAYLHNCKAEVNGTIHSTVQTALDAAANGQTIRISGVCGDLHQNGGPGQLLTLNKNVTLQGGWNETFTTLNPTAFPTILDSAGLGRVVYINGNFTPILENLVIRNGNASGLSGGPAGKDAGGGVYSNGGAPTFKNTDIANNQSPDLGAGVYLTGPNAANFQGGFVRNNSGAERGGGLYIDHSAPILTGVNIAGNSARGGGGVYLYRSPAQFLDNAAAGSAPTCRISNNSSSVMPNYVPGPDAGGLPVLWLAPGGGGGIVLDESAATLRGCAINGNMGRVGGGVYVHNSAAILENSLISANRAQQPNPAAILIGPGGVRDGDGGGLLLDNQEPAASTLRGLLLGSNEALRGSGMMTRLARGGTLSLPHFTINSNVGGSAVYALGESHLAFNNTIVAFNTGGAAIFAQSGPNGESATISLDRTLWHPPTQTKAGFGGSATVATTTDFNGDPAFKNDGYHLKRISFAYGVGASEATFADRDGHARPTGSNAELGTDEYATGYTVRYVMVGGSGSAPCTDYLAPCPSLQTAIDAASDGDFIKMAGGSYSGTRSDDGRIHYARILKGVTIEGGYFPRTDNNSVTDKSYTLHDWEDPHPLESPTIIDVAEQGRIFFISGNITPTFSNLTLRRGNALAQGDGPAGSPGGAGGAIYVDGASPIFKNIVVEDSRAHFGSGFYLRHAGGSYTGLTVRENGTGVSIGRGGGFYIEGGQPTIQGITIQSNLAITGAGVYLDNSAATLTQNSIQGNGDSSTLDGGGIYIVGGATTILTNTVTSNQAQHGGGLRLHNSNATVRGNSIDNNRAGSAPTPAGQNDALGGGLYIAGGTPLVTANSISNNQAVHPALALGGGIYVAQSGVNLHDNTLTANQAHRGGGLYFAATSNIIVQNNTLTRNRAQASDGNVRQAGGGVYFANAVISFTHNSLSQNSAVYGAGLYLAGSGRSRITHNSLTSNSAAKDGGGVYLDGSDAEVESNTIQDNRTTGGSGGGLFARGGQAALHTNSFLANQAALEGGGLYLSQDGSTLQGDTIQGNQAGDGGGIYVDGPAPGDAQPAPWLDRVTIADNQASNHGGGLFLRSSGAQITLSTLRDNAAAVDGGGALIEESTPAAFHGNVIRDNHAGDQGGGLYISKGSAGSYQSNAVVDNAAGQGGGIFVSGASPTLIHTTLARNGSGLIAVAQDAVASTVILTNTLVAGHSLGIQGESGTTVALFATLWDDNGTDFAGTATSNGNYEGEARFDTDGYHLTANSAAANKGISGDVAIGSDVDGEGRFQGNGPELGADELAAGCAIIINGNVSNPYTNLQQAINAAPDGGELRVAGTCSGVQTEGGTPQLAYFNKNLTVRGGYALGSWESSSSATQPSVLDARGQGRVVRLANGVRVTLANVTLINGSAAGLGGGPTGIDAGGNIYVNDAQVTLEGVDLINGRATVGSGLYLKASVALVANSNFRGNLATSSGGAIYLDNVPTSVEVRANRFTNNRAQDGAAIYGAAGAPLLLGNALQENQTSGSSGRGGGVFLLNSNAILTRNRLQSNRAGMGGGVYVAGGLPDLTNNMLVRNAATNSGGALYSVDAPLHLRNNTLVANATLQDGGGAIFFATPATSRSVILTNNILVDHSLAVSVGTGNQLTVRANLWHNNQTNWIGAVSEGPGNLQQEPLFVNRAAGDYHLLENSPAVDAGVSIGVNDDIDGQNRPARQGFDIGADEYLRPSISASLTALPDPVASGAQQTYVLRAINNGDVDLVARVQITLPAALTPEGATLWENVAIGRGAIWERNLIATVDGAYTGSLNALMGVTTDQGARATASVASTAAAISGEILEFSGESAPDPAAPGSTIELRLRITNRGAIPIGTTIRAILPDGLATSSPLVYAPTISGPDGIWSTRMNVTIAPDMAIETSAGTAAQLVTTFQVQTDSGFSRTYSIATTLARPAVQVSRTPSLRPAIAGKALTYNVVVTNSGNTPLAATINNSFPTQVALEELAQGHPFAVVLTPGQVWRQSITTTVEAGYVGPLAGSVQVTTDAGVSASAQDQVESQAQALTPTATAKGGDWHNPASWEPPGVPPMNAIVLIPENISLFSNRPITLDGLINRGSLELRNPIGFSQALTLTNLLENYGEILGKEGTGAGQPGVTLNMSSAVLYNEGTICAGDGAPDGGAGGDLIIVAGATTNKGIFCAGHGADVTRASANIPGGPGGNLLLSFDPGLFTNVGQLLAGNGGSSYPDAVPPQPGGDGGDITIVATAAARLDDSTLLAGQGGQGSSGATAGLLGQVVVGAPLISDEGTRFSEGTVLLIRGADGAYNFAAVAPDTVFLSPASRLAIFPIRVFNRGARQDTFIATPLATPDGWQVNNLPATLNLDAFRSNLIVVVLSIPTDQPGGSADQPFTIVVTSQHDSTNQVFIPLRVVMLDETFHIQLPRISR